MRAGRAGPSANAESRPGRGATESRLFRGLAASILPIEAAEDDMTEIRHTDTFRLRHRAAIVTQALIAGVAVAAALPVFAQDKPVALKLSSW
jgi:hypothetical protein